MDQITARSVCCSSSARSERISACPVLVEQLSEFSETCAIRIRQSESEIVCVCVCVCVRERERERERERKREREMERENPLVSPRRSEDSQPKGSAV